MHKEIKKIAGQVAKIIAEGINVNQIFLFGSYARGFDNADSDLDIFVVADLKNEKKIDLTQKARRLLLKNITMPVYIILFYTNDFKIKKGNKTTLEYIISTEGIKLYG
jgi:predicted nucleotidyltransferase